ncbi:hypothetical protein C0V76_15270 [Uliginosibacterium sp. TH139]|nr:hypothetical protein C0V76_15270 [Uliginosibacterium sp. TH139]
MPADGKVGRIDRWADAEDAALVLLCTIGYALTGVLLADYTQQIEGYREVMRAIFPGCRVNALLVLSESGAIKFEQA